MKEVRHQCAAPLRFGPLTFFCLRERGHWGFHRFTDRYWDDDLGPAPRPSRLWIWLSGAKQRFAK